MREGRERVVGRSGRRDEEGGKRKQGRGAKGRRDGESRRGANVREAREGREVDWGDGATRRLGREPGDERCTPLRAGRGIPTPGTHRRVVQGSNPTRPARDTNCNTATGTEGNMTLAARGDTPENASQDRECARRRPNQGPKLGGRRQASSHHPDFVDRMHHHVPFSARTGTTGRSIAGYPGPDTSARGAASGSSSFAASAECAGRSGPWAKGHAALRVRLKNDPERASRRRRPSRKSEGRRGAKTSFGLKTRSPRGVSCAGSRVSVLQRAGVGTFCAVKCVQSSTFWIRAKPFSNCAGNQNQL